MGAVLLLTRRGLRARWRSLAVVTLLVALAGAVTLTTVAGARRTSSSFDRFLTWSRSQHVLVLGTDIDAGDVTRIRDLPGVEALGVGRLMSLTGPDGDLLGGGAVVAPLDDVLGRDVYRVRVTAGRAPADGAADEIAISESLARVSGLQPAEKRKITGSTPVLTTTERASAGAGNPGSRRVQAGEAAVRSIRRRSRGGGRRLTLRIADQPQRGVGRRGHRRRGRELFHHQRASQTEPVRCVASLERRPGGCQRSLGWVSRCRPIWLRAGSLGGSDETQSRTACSQSGRGRSMPHRVLRQRIGLAALTGHQLPRASISAMERGFDGERRRRFDAHELYLLSQVFDVPIAYFLIPPPGMAGTELADTRRPVAELYRSLLGTDAQLEALESGSR